MIEKLIQFVPPNFSADATALVIEDEKYLSPLRELMPNSKIDFMTKEISSQLENFCRKLRVNLIIGNYLQGALPTESKIFDVIIADDCLTNSLYTYGTIAELGQLLKDSGFMLTKFFNARFIGMLENLRRGKFPTHEQKFWAKWDVVKLFHDAFYKEIYFLPDEKINADVDEWTNFGFDNFSDDLRTKIWLVKACKSTAEVIALKEVYTEKVRADLSQLLRRIEFGIDVEENFSRLKKLCQREMIFDEYLFDFMEQIVTHEDAKNFIRLKVASN